MVSIHKVLQANFYGQKKTKKMNLLLTCVFLFFTFHGSRETDSENYSVVLRHHSRCKIIITGHLYFNVLIFFFLYCIDRYIYIDFAILIEYIHRNIFHTIQFPHIYSFGSYIKYHTLVLLFFHHFCENFHSITTKCVYVCMNK